MLALLTFLAFPLWALASGDCYDPNPILVKRWQWDLQSPQNVALPLPTQTHLGPQPTGAQFSLQWNQQMAPSLSFPQIGDTFALPYSVHRWRLTVYYVDHSEVIDHDLTNDCSTLPASVYPGEKINFPYEKLSPPSQSSAALFELQVWGR